MGPCPRAGGNCHLLSETSCGLAHHLPTWFSRCLCSPCQTILLIPATCSKVFTQQSSPVPEIPPFRGLLNWKFNSAEMVCRAYRRQASGAVRNSSCSASFSGPAHPLWPQERPQTRERPPAPFYDLPLKAHSQPLFERLANHCSDMTKDSKTNSKQAARTQNLVWVS